MMTIVIKITISLHTCYQPVVPSEGIYSLFLSLSVDIVSNPLETWLSEGLWQVQILRLMWTFLARMTNSRQILGRVFLVECDDCFCRLRGPRHDKLKRKKKHLQYNIFTLWWLWTKQACNTCLVLILKFTTLVALQFGRQPKLVPTFHQIPLIRYYWHKQLVV